ncbi:uncharacterized protein LOC131933132 [Physella acuta]|uniref:uncharacterized protein LOC131933132 n=1 Tax=Physella acuta TaxID=109671 RepID=UPI0027DB6943|nr:uncharacterized protein LOC131933132 [Physella acuta]
MPQEPKEKISQSWRKTQKRNSLVKSVIEPTGQKGNSVSSSLKMEALIYPKNLDNVVSDANGNIITLQESGPSDASVSGTNSDVVKVVPDNGVSTKTAPPTSRGYDNNKTAPSAVQQARSRSRSTLRSSGCDSRNIPESSSGKKILAKRSQSVPRIDFRHREPPADKRWNSSNRFYSHNNMEQVTKKPTQKSWSRRFSGSFDGHQMPAVNANHWSRSGVRTTAPQSFNTDCFAHERFRHRVDMASKRYQFYEQNANPAQRGNRRWSTAGYDAQLTMKNTRQNEAFDQGRLSHPADAYHRAATDRLSGSHVTVSQPQQYSNIKTTHSDNSKTTASKKRSSSDNSAPRVLSTGVKHVRTLASTHQLNTAARLHTSLEHAASAVENSVPPVQYPAPNQHQPTTDVLQEFPIDLSRSAMISEPSNTKMIPSLPSSANTSASQNPDKNRTPDANVPGCTNDLDIKLLKRQSTNDTVKLITRLSSDAGGVTHHDTNLFTKNDINCAPNQAPDEPVRTRTTARTLDFCPRIDTSVPPPSHPQRANQTTVSKPRVTTQPTHMNTIRQDIQEEMARARSMSIPVNFNPNAQDNDQSRLNPSADEFSPTLKDAYGNSYTVSSSKGVFYFRPQVQLASNPNYVVATEPQYSAAQSIVGPVYNSGVVNMPYTMGVISQQPVPSYPTNDLQKPAYYLYDEHGQLSATLMTPGPQVTTPSYTPMLAPSVGAESLVFTFPQTITSQDQVYQFPVQPVLPQFCSTNSQYTTQTGVSSFAGYEQSCLTTQNFSYEPHVIQNSALLHNTQQDQHTPMIQIAHNLPMPNANYAISFPDQSLPIPFPESYPKNIDTENSPINQWSLPSPPTSSPSQESPPQASNFHSRSTRPQSQTTHAQVPQTPPGATQKTSDDDNDVTKSVAKRLVQFFKTGSMEKLRSNGASPGTLPADLDIVETLIDLIRVLQSRNPGLTDRDLVDIVHVHLQMFYMGAQSGSEEEKGGRRRCNK